MPVISPPPRQKLLRTYLKPVLLAIAGVLLVFFLRQRFGDTAIEKAERLFQKRELADLKTFTQKNLASGEISPVLMGYYAVAEYSVNPDAALKSLLNSILAVDDRVIFRREALQRIWQVEANRHRAGAILREIIALEKPPGTALKNLATEVMASESPLTGEASLFDDLADIFPQAVRRVAAKSLQMRAAPSTDGEVRRRLETGERLLVRKTGPLITVSGKKGRWAYALDGNLESGWVFDGYLQTPSSVASGKAVPPAP